MLKEFVEQGKPLPPFPVVISLPTATDRVVRVVADVVYPQTLNAGVSFLSVRTAGRSAIGFLYTEDQVAKTFYALGFVFAGTAAGFSSSAFLSKACLINHVGVVGESIGEACYQVAEEANRLARARDKKIIPVVPMRKPIWNRNSGPAAFILPSSNRSRVYSIIMSNVVFIVTVYGYIKIIRTT